ncbi:hypothetical protein DIPPA_34684 [Diplonema papillatum]|nr:hypothetical protein DIPPA_34684 [Diplonema papillatum]
MRVEGAGRSDPEVWLRAYLQRKQRALERAGSDLQRGQSCLFGGSGASSAAHALSFGPASSVDIFSSPASRARLGLSSGESPVDGPLWAMGALSSLPTEIVPVAPSSSAASSDPQATPPEAAFLRADHAPAANFCPPSPGAPPDGCASSGGLPLQEQRTRFASSPVDRTGGGGTSRDAQAAVGEDPAVLGESDGSRGRNRIRSAPPGGSGVRPLRESGVATALVDSGGDEALRSGGDEALRSAVEALRSGSGETLRSGGDDTSRSGGGEALGSGSSSSLLAPRADVGSQAEVRVRPWDDTATLLRQTLQSVLAEREQAVEQRLLSALAEGLAAHRPAPPEEPRRATARNGHGAQPRAGPGSTAHPQPYVPAEGGSSAPLGNTSTAGVRVDRADGGVAGLRQTVGDARREAAAVVLQAWFRTHLAASAARRRWRGRRGVWATAGARQPCGAGCWPEDAGELDALRAEERAARSRVAAAQSAGAARCKAAAELGADCQAKRELLGFHCRSKLEALLAAEASCRRAIAAGTLRRLARGSAARRAARAAAQQAGSCQSNLEALPVTGESRRRAEQKQKLETNELGRTAVAASGEQNGDRLSPRADLPFDPSSCHECRQGSSLRRSAAAGTLQRFARCSAARRAFVARRRAAVGHVASLLSRSEPGGCRGNLEALLATEESRCRAVAAAGALQQFARCAAARRASAARQRAAAGYVATLLRSEAGTAPRPPALAERSRDTSPRPPPAAAAEAPPLREHERHFPSAGRLIGPEEAPASILDAAQAVPASTPESLPATPDEAKGGHLSRLFAGLHLTVAEILEGKEIDASVRRDLCDVLYGRLHFNDQSPEETESGLSETVAQVAYGRGLLAVGRIAAEQGTANSDATDSLRGNSIGKVAIGDRLEGTALSGSSASRNGGDRAEYEERLTRTPTGYQVGPADGVSVVQRGSSGVPLPAAFGYSTLGDTGDLTLNKRCKSTGALPSADGSLTATGDNLVGKSSSWSCFRDRCRSPGACEASPTGSPFSPRIGMMPKKQCSFSTVADGPLSPVGLSQALCRSGKREPSAHGSRASGCSFGRTRHSSGGSGGSGVSQSPPYRSDAASDQHSTIVLCDVRDAAVLSPRQHPLGLSLASTVRDRAHPLSHPALEDCSQPWALTSSMSLRPEFADILDFDLPQQMLVTESMTGFQSTSKMTSSMQESTGESSLSFRTVSGYYSRGRLPRNAGSIRLRSPLQRKSTDSTSATQWTINTTDGSQCAEIGSADAAETRDSESSEVESTNSSSSSESVQLPAGASRVQAGLWRLYVPPSAAVLIAIGAGIGLSLFLAAVLVLQIGVSVTAMSPLISIVFTCLLLLARVGWGASLYFSDDRRCLLLCSVHVLFPCLSHSREISYDYISVDTFLRKSVHGEVHIAILTFNTKLPIFAVPLCSSYKGIVLCETFSNSVVNQWVDFVLSRVKPRV